MSAPTRIGVGGDYEVTVGNGLVDEVASGIDHSVERVLLVHPATLTTLAGQVADRVRAHGVTAHLAPVPDAEMAKSAEVASSLWALLGREGFTRSDLIISVGGGTVTDLAGFVAATWLRGVPVIHIPTTLLGMVDAAVGGKTGINTAEGKNLVGCFHPPRAVVCDLDVLSTLPQADFVAGLAEVVKTGFIADPVILDLIEDDPESARGPGGAHTRELIERSITVKADVVSRDLREASLREILNYGHTFAHAIEQVEGYRWRHGEAVSVGMIYVAELAHAVGRIDGALVARHREVLTGLGLPVSYSGGRWDALLAAMRRDKKSRGALLRFVVLDGLAQPGRLEGPDMRLLESSYAALAEK